MSEEKVCVNCGKLKKEHSCLEYKEMRYEDEIIFPEGCVCIKETWEHNPPKVCDKFKSSSEEKEAMCLECSHDKECHD